MSNVQNELGSLVDELVLHIMRQMPSLYDRWNMMHCCSRFVSIQRDAGALGLLGDLTKTQRDVNANFAAYYGHDLLLSALLKAGADSHETVCMGWTKLAFAAKHGHHLCVRVLLEAGSDPVNANNAKDDGYNALMLAAQNGHDLCVRALIEATVNLEAVQVQGFTALMLASKTGHDLCVRVLLEAGSEPGKANGDGYTALMLAAQNGHDLCVRALIEAKADPN